jgi:tetratricopeptide (TPR) repeat protein
MSKRTKVLFVVFLVLACPALSRTAVGANHESKSPPSKEGGVTVVPDIPGAVSAELERQLLAADWRGLVDYLKSHPKSLSDHAVLRAIGGHACLAINANDASLLMFRSLGTEADKVAWKQWTEQFLGRNPGQPVAHYLHGDALARLGDWDGAIKTYTAGLDAAAPVARTKAPAVHEKASAGSADSSVIALLHNARGVARGELRRALVARRPDGTDQSARLQWKKQIDESYQAAEADFEKACAVAPRLADPRANLACLKLLRKTYDAAAKDFDLALKESPGFSLAMVGKASALMGMGQKNEAEAEKLFVRACDFPAVASLAAANDVAIQEAKLLLATSRNSAATSTPGTTVTEETRAAVRQMQNVLESKLSPAEKQNYVNGSFKNDPQNTPEVVKRALRNMADAELRGNLEDARIRDQMSKQEDTFGRNRQGREFASSVGGPLNPLAWALKVTEDVAKRNLEDTGKVYAARQEVKKDRQDGIEVAAQFMKERPSTVRKDAPPPGGGGGMAPNGPTASTATPSGATPSSSPAKKTPGGVSMDLGRDRNSRRDWPVQTWFGLAQATPMPAIGQDASASDAAPK